MVGLMDYISGNGMWAADTDDLLRAAQAGSLPAYRELIKRGEMVQPSASDQGRHGRPGGPRPQPLGADRGAEGLGLSYLSGMQGNDNTPPYLTSGIPGGTPSAMDPTLLFGNRGRAATPPNLGSAALPGVGQPAYQGGMPNLDIPPYLQRGQVPEAQGPSPAEQMLTRIANGGDGAAAIQAGSRAAAATAGDPQGGVADTGGLPVPGALGPLAQAMAQLDDEPDDKYGGAIDDIIQQLTKGKDPNANRMNAMAQAGFAMAASGSPTFFGAVGQGGLTGMRAYQESQRQDMIDRINAAKLAQGQQQIGDDRQRTKFGQTMDVAKQTEVQAENQRQDARARQQLDEQARHDRETEAYNRGALQVSSTNALTSLNQLKLEQSKFNEVQRQYNDGKASKDKLDAAEIKLREAQARSYDAMGVTRNTKVINGVNGTYAYELSTGKTAAIVDPDGKPIVARSATGMLSDQKRAQWWVSLGLYPDEASAAKAMQAAKAWNPEQRLAHAKADAAAVVNADPMSMSDPDAAEQRRQELTAQYLQEYEDAAASGPASGGPSTEAPAGSTAPGSNPSQIPVGATATNPQTKQKVRWDGKNWVPVK